MARSKPSLVRLSDLQQGQLADFYALLQERTKGSTRTGKDYYICRFRDPHRTVAFMVWSDSEFIDVCEKEWQVGMFFKIRGTYTEHEQYGPQIEIVKLRPVQESDKEDGFSEADFLERSRFNVDMMFDELKSIAQSHLQQPPVRQLVLSILEQHAEKIKQLPATQRHYYPFPGGWLEHILAVTRNCLWLGEQFATRYPDLKPALNRDLLLCGAILHEIGRVPEFELPTDLSQPIDITVPGRLFGHLFLGVDLVRSAAKEIDGLHPQFIELLAHVILSHLQLPEWGSPRLPLIPEVLILHHADDMDAKFEMYARCLQRDVSSGPFTERDPVLGKQLLKQREV